jgi:hypothetical protein
MADIRIGDVIIDNRAVQWAVTMRGVRSVVAENDKGDRKAFEPRNLECLDHDMGLWAEIES